MNTLLQINTVVNSGSTGRITEELGQIVIQDGWKSIIAYGRNPLSSSSTLFRIGSDFKVYMHGLQTRFFDRHGLASKLPTMKFVEYIKSCKPNIIHLHNLHGYYLNIEVLFNYLSSTNIPIIWTLHDCWPITGHCVYFDFAGCDRWKSGCHHCPQKTTYPASYCLDRSKKNYGLKKEIFTSVTNMTIVPVSNWLSDIVRESYLSAFPSRTINNGIDTEVFKPSDNETIKIKYHLENKFIILGVASPWSARKGFSDFIELSRRLNSNSRIVLVGLDKKHLKNLPVNITGIARTENLTELAGLYSAADVFVNPTWEDNFPTTNLEALACGTPVITYDTGGSVESVSGQTGYIVEKGNINELMATIEKVRIQGKHHYSAACVDRAKKLYRKQDRYKDYFDLYESLLSH